MSGRLRTVLAAIAVALILVIPLLLLFTSGEDDDPTQAETGAGLRIERSGPQLIVYVDPVDNVPERTGGARAVTVRCVDASGRLVIAQDAAWPFTDTDSGTLDPHVHVSLDPATLDTVASCRVLGTDPLLEADAP